METKELLKKVRTIEIKTRGLSRQIFAGEYHSAFKGKGMAFSEVREYQVGDPIKNIDWHVTARFNHPYIKIFEEERELTVMLLVDVSSSQEFGTRERLKNELVAEVSAVLSFSAIHNNDKIGVIFFSDKVEKFIPPKKGKKHILRIIREMIDFQPESKGTNIAEALRYLTNAIKKRCTAFVISDFIDDNPYLDAMRIAGNKHDVVALRVFDERDVELPNVGMVKMKDPESNNTLLVDTSEKKTRALYRQHYNAFRQKSIEHFRKSGVDFAELKTNVDYVKPLIALFKRR
ncbi:MAG: DUF58 domain-containing protein [Candidatus Delongbacteria bacterium]|jgi:uncharacterized protein (DUF58 family)|nr:DUF58 domain-containing protein [Candidatus Delongbacteria bacterium]